MFWLTSGESEQLSPLRAAAPPCREEPVEVVQGIRWGCIPDVSLGRACGHVQSGGDPEADQGQAGGITFAIQPWNASVFKNAAAMTQSWIAEIWILFYYQYEATMQF